MKPSRSGGSCPPDRCGEFGMSLGEGTSLRKFFIGQGALDVGVRADQFARRVIDPPSIDVLLDTAGSDEYLHFAVVDFPSPHHFGVVLWIIAEAKIVRFESRPFLRHRGCIRLHSKPPGLAKMLRLSRTSVLSDIVQINKKALTIQPAVRRKI